jgi:hypothetical protein
VETGDCGVDVAPVVIKLYISSKEWKVDVEIETEGYKLWIANVAPIRAIDIDRIPRESLVFLVMIMNIISFYIYPSKVWITKVISTQ